MNIQSPHTPSPNQPASPQATPPAQAAPANPPAIQRNILPVHQTPRPRLGYLPLLPFNSPVNQRVVLQPRQPENGYATPPAHIQMALPLGAGFFQAPPPAPAVVQLAPSPLLLVKAEPVGRGEAARNLPVIPMLNDADGQVRQGNRPSLQPRSNTRLQPRQQP